MNITNEEEPKPFLEPGELYRLQGLKGNNLYTHMQAYDCVTHSRLMIVNPNHSRARTERLYTDGDLFMCIKLKEDVLYNNAGVKLAYLMLAPDGKQVTLPHYQNKGKFAKAARGTKRRK